MGCERPLIVAVQGKQRRGIGMTKTPAGQARTVGMLRGLHAILDLVADCNAGPGSLLVGTDGVTDVGWMTEEAPFGVASGLGSSAADLDLLATLVRKTNETIGSSSMGAGLGRHRPTTTTAPARKAGRRRGRTKPFLRPLFADTDAFFRRHTFLRGDYNGPQAPVDLVRGVTSGIYTPSDLKFTVKNTFLTFHPVVELSESAPGGAPKPGKSGATTGAAARRAQSA